MFPLGFFILLAGVWLADSAFHGRPPLKTLEEILKNPGDMRAILDDQKGSTEYNVAAVTQRIAGAYPGGGGFPTNTAHGDIGKVVSFLHAQVGKPYKWGAAGPNAFDCSGLGYAAYKSVGITIPRTTAAMLADPRAKTISKKNLQPGDAVFPYPGHVFWYVGSGVCVEAPHTGEFVHLTKMYQFMTARRFVK